MASILAVTRAISIKVPGIASHIVRGRVASVLSSNTNNTSMSTSSSSINQSESMNLSGIYPPIITPFDKEENITYEQMQNNLKCLNDVPFKGYVVQGSNGEYVFLSKQERVEVVEKVRQMIPKGKLILAGSGCESTRDTIEMGRLMAEAGADALLVVTPCYYKSGMTADALFQHYTKVADTSPVPIILYSVPSNTGVDLPAETTIQLSSHPNIIGIKESGGDVAKIGLIVHKTKNNDFQVLAGSASFLTQAYSVGAVGGVCALANVLGKECCDLHELYNSGKYDEARALQHRLIAPNTAVTRTFGVPGLKQAMEWFGYYGGPLRSPLLPLTKPQIEAVRNSFTDNGFL